MHVWTRLEQLLALGSLTVKEESGYVAFFHHLLKPMVHYAPFYIKVITRRGQRCMVAVVRAVQTRLTPGMLATRAQAPEEVLGVLEWAQRHDAEAQRIAQAGQRFAQTFLHQRALSCYWLRLLQRYAQLQRFEPAGAARAYKWRVPLEHWLTKGEGGTFVRKWRISVEA